VHAIVLGKPNIIVQRCADDLPESVQVLGRLSVRCDRLRRVEVIEVEVAPHGPVETSQRSLMSLAKPTQVSSPGQWWSPPRRTAGSPP
jgi:hypothetical protein